MEPNNYRLERWIAVILSLLFLLPFVAQAQDILYTSDFYEDEVSVRDGEEFLALICSENNALLQPAKVRVREELDVKSISVAGMENAWLIRGKHLRAGSVTTAKPACSESPVDSPVAMAFAGNRYTLSNRCSTTPDPDGFVDCSIVLESAGQTQLLAQVQGLHDEPAKVMINFAGDLDRDGKLDLIVDIAEGFHEWHPALFLSGAARKGDLLAKVAELVSWGC